MSAEVRAKKMAEETPASGNGGDGHANGHTAEAESEPQPPPFGLVLEADAPILAPGEKLFELFGRIIHCVGRNQWAAWACTMPPTPRHKFRHVIASDVG